MTWAELLATNKVPLIFLGLALVLAFFFSGGSKTTSGTTSSWKKWVGWIVGLTIIVALIYAGFLFLPGLYHKYQPGKSSKVPIAGVEATNGVVGAESNQTGQVKVPMRWYYSWELAPGKRTRDGNDKQNLLGARMVQNDKRGLEYIVDTHYYGVLRSDYYRLEPTRDGRMSGNWLGTYPQRREGTIWLRKENENLWRGQATEVQNGIELTYEVKLELREEVSKPKTGGGT